MIRIWKFGDAPQHLRDLCPCATDATWVVDVPSEFRDEVEAMFKDQHSPLKNVLSVNVPSGGVVIFAEKPIERFDQSSSKEQTSASGV